MIEQQWLTGCPECGAKESLIVTEITISATGERKIINSKLDPDGFGFEYERKDSSTEDEIVICAHCTRKYYLEDLLIDHEGPYQIVEDIKDRVFVVATETTIASNNTFEDKKYFGDILLVTDDEAKAKIITERFNNNDEILGLNREKITDGKAVYFERTLNETIKTEDL